MQVLVLVAVIRDSSQKVKITHVRGPKSQVPRVQDVHFPSTRHDGKMERTKLRKCRNASTFLLLTPISLPLSRLILIHSLHQYLSAYTHMPTNSLILKREHFRRWVTMFFTSEFSTTQTFLTPLIMPTPTPAEDEDETKSQSSAPAFLPSVHQHRRTSLDIYIDEQQRISSLDRNFLPR